MWCGDISNFEYSTLHPQSTDQLRDCCGITPSRKMVKAVLSLVFTLRCQQHPNIVQEKSMCEWYRRRNVDKNFLRVQYVEISVESLASSLWNEHHQVHIVRLTCIFQLQWMQHEKLPTSLDSLHTVPIPPRRWILFSISVIVDLLGNKG